jgi:hypothetical protein
MRNTGLTLFMGCVLGVSAKGMAQWPALIGVTFDEEIIRIDPSTGIGTLIGTLPTNANAFGVSYYDEKLWVLDQTADQLLVLDPATADILYTLPIVGFSMNGISSEGDFEISRAGIGYFIEAGGEFNMLDIETGFADERTARGPDNIDGLAFAPNGVLWALQMGGDLYTVNPQTVAFTKRFEWSALEGLVGGMEFGPDGTPYVVSDDTFFRVDLSNGAYTTIGAIGFDNVSGLTLAIVPEPTFLSAAVVMTGLARRSRR